MLARKGNMDQPFATNQSDVEREVRNVLARYKLAMINCHYQNWWHRLSVWLGDDEANEADRELKSAKNAALSTCQKSNEHARWVRIISAQQPEHVRDKDNFLALIHKSAE